MNKTYFRRQYSLRLLNFGVVLRLEKEIPECSGILDFYCPRCPVQKSLTALESLALKVGIDRQTAFSALRGLAGAALPAALRARLLTGDVRRLPPC